jgi:hypothetical protein
MPAHPCFSSTDHGVAGCAGLTQMASPTQMTPMHADIFNAAPPRPHHKQRRLGTSPFHLRASAPIPADLR